MAEVARPGAEKWVPEGADLAALRHAAPDCRGCELYRDATQVVFSSGAVSASLVLVGEQPGDREDREGEPFVGPAGRLLAEAVEAAGIPRGSLYVTNAVKHFRFERRGKRRIHQKPDVGHIEACHPWLAAELGIVRPRVVVCLGATAVRSVLGRPLPIARNRGRVLAEGGMTVVITTHPSALLRIEDPADREAAFTALVDDLKLARRTAG